MSLSDQIIGNRTIPGGVTCTQSDIIARVRGVSAHERHERAEREESIGVHVSGYACKADGEHLAVLSGILGLRHCGEILLFRDRKWKDAGGSTPLIFPSPLREQLQASTVFSVRETGRFMLISQLHIF